LHTHTGFDKTKHFGEDVQSALMAWNKSNQKPIKEMAYRFFDACQKAELELVAITDHNSLDAYGYFKPFLDEWFQETHYDLTVLPGIELTVGGERNLHILVIGEDNIDVDKFKEYLVSAFAGQERFAMDDTPVSCGKNLSEFLLYTREWFEKAKYQYLLIPAHVNKNSGVESEIRSATPGTWETELSGLLRQRAFAQKMWAGFQVKGDPKGIPGFESLLHSWAAAFYYRSSFERLSQADKNKIRNRKHWPLIETSDPDKLGEVGKAFTWMKVSVPNIN
jgi:hypothetical protein